MEELSEFDIASVAYDLNRKLFLDYLLGKQFMLRHDLSGSTSIITSDGSIRGINGSGVGLNVELRQGIAGADSEFLCIPIATFAPREQKGPITYPLDALYKVFAGLETDIFTSFCPASVEEITKLKHDAEDRISKIEVRLSHGLNYKDIGRNTSTATDSYYQSYEKKLLGMVLENINEILISKCSSYKVIFFVKSSDKADGIVKYLKSNSVVLSQEHFRSKNMLDLYNHAKKMDAVPLSYANAAQAIGLSSRVTHLTRVRTGEASGNGDINIGNYLDSGINETNEQVSISSSALNLGTLITGLPGTGKTRLTQSLIEQVFRLDSKVAIISPTGEWNGFGSKNSITVLNLGRADNRINFFKCEVPNSRKFYENLAMLVAVGCNSGPYKNSVEKCLIAAFSKAYSKTSNPDPQLVYEEIEEAIIEQHGKRTSTSVKYTKHGENARAALESLRQLLMMPQFAYGEGISFRDIVAKGVIFDLSEISNNAKPLIYAMILNQLYNICDQFDLDGDNEVRLTLCLEEAQLIFNAEDESGATLDLKERIQNFRKTGVGLVLITHNINDISPEIRRLCQNKFYFRQSADVARYAANDLVFDELEYSKVIMILKTLGQRECAVNAITVKDGRKTVSNSIFSKVSDYACPELGIGVENTCIKPRKTTIKIVYSKDAEQRLRYTIYYLGERITHGTTNGTEITEEGLLEDRFYKLVAIGARKRDNREFEIVGGSENTITLQETTN